MKPIPALALAFATLFTPLAASAQVARVEVHDPYYPGTRFATRDLRIDGKNQVLELERGGVRVDATLEVQVDCRDCGPQSQLLVGFANEPSAQACVWSGNVSSKGFTQARFALNVPDAPGIYEVRARQVRARSCGEAINDWRRVDGGPDSNIGVVVVYTDGRPDVRPGHGDRKDRVTRRELRELERAIDDITTRLEQIQREQLDLSSRGASNKRQRRMNELTREAMNLTMDLRSVQAEIRDLIEDQGRPRPQPVEMPRVRIPRPQIIVIADAEPLPAILPPPEMQQLLRALEDATFSDPQKNVLRDYLHAGAFFSTAQARRIMDEFPHDTDKVDVGVMLCPRIVDPAPLPQLLQAFTFESYRQELRNRTKNQCGMRR